MIEKRNLSAYRGHEFTNAPYTLFRHTSFNELINCQLVEGAKRRKMRNEIKFMVCSSVF